MNPSPLVLFFCFKPQTWLSYTEKSKLNYVLQEEEKYFKMAIHKPAKEVGENSQREYLEKLIQHLSLVPWTPFLD